MLEILPPLILMIRSPLIMVQPFKLWISSKLAIVMPWHSNVQFLQAYLK